MNEIEAIERMELSLYNTDCLLEAFIEDDPEILESYKLDKEMTVLAIAALRHAEPPKVASEDVQNAIDDVELDLSYGEQQEQGSIAVDVAKLRKVIEYAKGGAK